MAKIYNPPPRTPVWPWGGPRSVREKLVDPTQLDRKKKLKKGGDPKNPALASFALLEFLGPGHTAEELRLPMPPHPEGHDADLAGFNDAPHLGSVAERNDPNLQSTMERGLTRISAAPDRVDRLKALLQRESQMLGLVGKLSDELKDIQRRMREEQAEEGY
jgi:hypothetical protein